MVAICINPHSLFQLPIVTESFESYFVASQFGNILLTAFVINRVLVKIIYQAHQNKNNCVRSRKANILDEGIFWL